MNRKSHMETLLRDTLQPSLLEVMDESHLHAGHVGARPGGETHFRVILIAEAFAGKSRVARHRMVYDALKPALEAGVHALSIDAKAPGEMN